MEAFYSRLVKENLGSFHRVLVTIKLSELELWNGIVTELMAQATIFCSSNSTSALNLKVLGSSANFNLYKYLLSVRLIAPIMIYTPSFYRDTSSVAMETCFVINFRNYFKS